MAVNCGVSFGLCRTRVTRVDSNGNVLAGQNGYVTDAALSISVTPNIETGTAISVRNGGALRSCLEMAWFRGRRLEAKWRRPCERYCWGS